MSDPARTALYEAIARPSGGFAMVAIDARESMRVLFRDAKRPDSDQDLSRFKALVADRLAPMASAVLCDTLFGEAAIRVMREEHESTGLIVAVDRFDEPRYGPLVEAYLDDAIMADVVGLGGVSALKLYLFWHPDGTPHFREDDARRFVGRCRDLGVLALLEGVVRAPAGHPDFGGALLAAAEAMGRVRPDIYKTQLPTLGAGDDATIEREAARLSEAVGVPWVVLSNGVPLERFVSAAAAACRGGASGVLAGRALWRQSLVAENADVELTTAGAERMREINEVVDREARPWFDAVES